MQCFSLILSYHSILLLVHHVSKNNHHSFEEHSNLNSFSPFLPPPPFYSSTPPATHTSSQPSCPCNIKLSLLIVNNKKLRVCFDLFLKTLENLKNILLFSEKFYFFFLKRCFFLCFLCILELRTKHVFLFPCSPYFL